MHAFIQWIFIVHLLCAGLWDTAVNKPDKNPCPYGTFILIMKKDKMSVWMNEWDI